jgi:hypothetical protein
MSIDAWILYAIGFLAMLTSSVEDPRLAGKMPIVFLLAALWPIAAIGLVIVRMWGMFRHG